MDPDDAADLLSELPEEDKERLLALMRPDDAADVRRLLSYEERTAGGLMTTEPIVLRPDATVADALARVRQQDLSPALAAQVYVCRPPDETPTGKYLGTVHFQRLLRDPPFTLVSSIVDSDLRPAGAGHPAARRDQLSGRVQHGLGARRGRERLAAGRGDRRRRAGPPAARGLARDRLPAARRRSAGWPLRTGARAVPTGASGIVRPPRPRLDQPQAPRRRLLPEYDPEAFGRLSERIARFLGTGRFIVWMTLIIIAVGGVEHLRARATCASTSTRSSS